MSAILKTPMIQTMLAEMSTAQVSSMLAMMDTDQVPTDYTIGMASGGIPTTLATNPSFVTISMKQFYVMKTTADTPDTADLRKETKKVTGALYQPTAGTPNYSFIEFGQDICRFWAFINGQALIVPETLSTVELRAEVLKRELKNFSTAISCDAQGNVEIGRNLTVDGYINQNSWEFDTPLGLTLETAAETAGFSIYYQHERVSNGKLNIVVGLACKNPSADWNGTLFYMGIAVPESVGSKIYVSIGETVDAKQIESPNLNNDGTFQNANPSQSYCNFQIRKASNTSLIAFSTANVKANATGNYLWRFEFNFILS